MLEKLIIFIHAENVTQPSWIVINAALEVQQQVNQGNAEELVAISTDKEIIVIVSAEDVLLLNAKLPKMPRSRLEQALPFALEEQLICDVDKLHFTHGIHQEGDLPVAVVAKEKMAQWMALLQTWNIVADKMLPAMLVLPWQENTWQVAITNTALVRTDLYSGFACEISNLREMLDIALSTAAQMPDKINICYYNEKTEHVDLSAPVPILEESKSAAQFYIDLALNSHTPAINLLQGAFATKKSKFTQTKRIWHMAIGLAAAWIAILFLYPLLSYFILESRVSHLNAAIAEIYKRNFPLATDVIAPKLRMQEKLQKLNNGAGQNRYFILLGYLGQGLQNSSGVKFKRMEYQNNQLNVELLANSSDEFSKFTDYLSQQGLKVKQQNANLNGTHISTTLVIE